MPALTVKGSELRDAAAWAVRLCPSGNAYPILQGILIETGDDAITLSAYDLETSGSVTIPATVSTPGAVIVSGRLLAAISKTFTAKSEVVFTGESNGADIAVGRNRWSLPTLSLDEFPELPGVGPAVAKLDAQALRRALSRVLPAADHVPSGRLHATMKLEIAGHEVAAVATDGFRGAVAMIECEPVDTGLNLDVQLPTIFAEAITRALPSSVAAAELGVTSGLLTLGTPSTRLSGRQGAVEWPDWRGFLPPVETDVEAIFVVADLSTAVERVTAVADPEKSIRISMGPDGIVLDAIDDRGTVSSEATVSEYRGEPKVSAIKPRYLLDALRTM